MLYFTCNGTFTLCNCFFLNLQPTIGMCYQLRELSVRVPYCEGLVVCGIVYTPHSAEGFSVLHDLISHRNKAEGKF